MSIGPQILTVDTPQGPGRFFVTRGAEQEAMLVLGHGAGGGVTAMDLELLAQRMPVRGVTVVRFEQPWRTAGRKVAVPPPKLDEAWLAAVGWLVAQSWTPRLLFFGGRSAGARVACRTADRFDVAGIVCLAFPLHLPGQPAKSRAHELLTPRAPRLVLQGSNDSFGRPEEIRAAIGDRAGISLVELPGADHSYRIARRRGEEERVDNALSSASDDEVGGFERDPQRAERAVEHRIARRRGEEERVDNALSSASDDEVGGFERDPQRAERAVEHRIARRRGEEERVDNALSSASDDEVGGFEHDPQRAERAVEHPTAKGAPFTPADLRATLVTQVGAFVDRRVAESAGISPGCPR